MRKYVLAVTTPVVAVAALLAAAGPASAADHSAGLSVQALRLTGAQEAPTTGDADGFGVFVATFDVKHNRFCYVVTAHKIVTPTAAHVHLAPPGRPGGVIVELMAPARGASAACVTAVPESTTAGVLTIPELKAIVASPSSYYVNVHNAEFPAGAIRAQFK